MDPHLKGMMVRGEISNLKQPVSGHIYFSLKDSGGVIRAVMFASAVRSLKFRPENGQRVIARGSVTFYERAGEVELSVVDLQPDGIGALYMGLEQTKAQLAAEGLFAPDRKRPLPPFPHCVGVVTSKTGAAVRDIIHVIKRRNPAVNIVVAPVQVQGTEAPASIVSALTLMNRCEGVDVVIVGRGGGSVEDLWAFNNADVVRAIADSRVPVVSAVGHETDITLSDLAADVRAATPSAAAEMVVPVLAETRNYVVELGRQLRQAMRLGLNRRAQLLAGLADRGALKYPQRMWERRRERIRALSTRLNSGMGAVVKRKAGETGVLSAKLEALSPFAALKRGYSITVGPNGQVLTDAAKVSAGEVVKTILSAGTIISSVTEVRKGEAPDGSGKDLV
jgi:exodeoxyribonuclease VII large subunit